MESRGYPYMDLHIVFYMQFHVQSQWNIGLHVPFPILIVLHDYHMCSAIVLHLACCIIVRNMHCSAFAIVYNQIASITITMCNWVLHHVHVILCFALLGVLAGQCSTCSSYAHDRRSYAQGVGQPYHYLQLGITILLCMSI